MGGDLTKELRVHGEHVPELNSKLTNDVWCELVTGATFVAMSNSTGDLPIHECPSIILDSTLEFKEYQDCIYEINRRSIHRYARLCSVLRRVEKGKANWELYYSYLDKFINEIELTCVDLNKFILKNHNLLFIPFIDILRDETNNQYFGIIIDKINKEKTTKKKGNNNKNKSKNNKNNGFGSLFHCFSKNDKNDKNDKNRDLTDDSNENEMRSNNNDNDNNNNNNNNNSSNNMNGESGKTDHKDSVSKLSVNNTSEILKIDSLIEEASMAQRVSFESTQTQSDVNSVLSSPSSRSTKSTTMTQELKIYIPKKYRVGPK